MEAQKYRVNKEMSAEIISLTRALCSDVSELRLTQLNMDFFTDYNRFY